MNTCESCRHWCKLNDESRTVSVGLCNPPERNLAAQVTVVLGSPQQAESTSSDLFFTEATFGCIHHEESNANPPHR